MVFTASSCRQTLSDQVQNQRQLMDSLSASSEAH